MKSWLRILVICVVATWSVPAWALADDSYECESIVAVSEHGLFKTYKGLDGLRPWSQESEAQYRQELSEYEKRTSGEH